jgi:hypothetical protein
MSDGDTDTGDPTSPASAPAAWVVWNDETGGPLTWVYRPDTFDADTFPAACIPTIHVTNRQGDRRPPGRGSGSWQARLLLEPEIEVDRSGACPTREQALGHAVELARQFVEGEYDLRGAYHDPSDREDYLDRLSAALSCASERGG